MRPDDIRALEESLLTVEVRSDARELDRLLADDFVEFGSSGRISPGDAHGERLAVTVRRTSMPVAVPLDTPRLRLRRWLPADRAPFASLNADPRVMQYLPSVLSRAESDAPVDRIETHFEEHGFGRRVMARLEPAP